MSYNKLIIEERSRDIGDFLVGRLIPFRKKRMVGPFAFIDHMGPSEIGNGKFLDVDQHPHIGLATLTYLLEGQIHHNDSIGTSQIITPESVNWMVAGKGCSHTERTPEALRENGNHKLHGYQIWIALPKQLEDIDPEFHHIKANQLPNWSDGSTSFKLIAGKGFGKESPVPVHSPLFMVEIKTKEAYRFSAKGKLQGEIGICIVSGGIKACDESIKEGNMLISKTEDICDILIQPDTHLLLFGGEPFPEERHIFWNFVSHSKEKIEEAKTNWENRNWPKVKGDETYVPLPKPPQFK
ncbi:pirin family protein [Spongiivirga citrea]|uniref:Pirin family protein n=1 Tax=Spongiivirga citrea TaxID=1481457 RepID=A0A6M0CQP7_9FLAO|nr:pirin family protein [Spongiivirga citrea]NER18374.1 pirin family protein [Spongiivirga citrea]